MERLLSNRMVSGVLDSVTIPVRDWLIDHPLIYWLVSHPLWLLGLIVVLILLLAGLVGAIARLTENLWLAVLRSPLSLSRWLWKLVSPLISPLIPKLPLWHTLWHNQPPVETVTPQQRLVDLLNRLDTLQQQQDEVLQEVRALLKPSP